MSKLDEIVEDILSYDQEILEPAGYLFYDYLRKLLPIALAAVNARNAITKHADSADDWTREPLAALLAEIDKLVGN